MVMLHFPGVDIFTFFFVCLVLTFFCVLALSTHTFSAKALAALA